MQKTGQMRFPQRVHCLDPDACEFCCARLADFTASYLMSSVLIVVLSFETFCAHASRLLMTSLSKVSSHYTAISNAQGQWLAEKNKKNKSPKRSNQH